MASSWGNSWLTSWGNSWGPIVATPDIVTSGGWQRLSVQAYAERVALRKQLEEEIAEPIREAIAAQSTTRFVSQEAEERAIKAAADAARIEYQALYMRLLAYQRQELLMEEEAIVMTMIAALSE